MEKEGWTPIAVLIAVLLLLVLVFAFIFSVGLRSNLLGNMPWIRAGIETILLLMGLR